jgi:hypothetical protein
MCRHLYLVYQSKLSCTGASNMTSYLRIVVMVPFVAAFMLLQAQTTTANGFSLYENSAYRFTIQYPSDWQVHEFDVTPLMVNMNTKSPALAVFQTVGFFLQNKSVTDTGAYTYTTE